MKLLIAISSCQRDKANGFNEACRNTWIPSIVAEGWDYKFFVGDKPNNGFLHMQPDEVFLPVDDSYIGLVMKTRESLRWALEHEYTHVWRCFTDSYIVMPTFAQKMKQELWEAYDLVGVIPSQPEPNGWFYPFGGSGYLTSRRAMEAIVRTEVPVPKKEDWQSFAEDVWAGMALKPYIETWLRWKPVSGLGMEARHYHPRVATLHLSLGDSSFENTTRYEAQWMHDAHKKVLECGC